MPEARYSDEDGSNEYEKDSTDDDSDTDLIEKQPLTYSMSYNGQMLCRGLMYLLILMFLLWACELQK